MSDGIFSLIFYDGSGHFLQYKYILLYFNGTRVKDQKVSCVSTKKWYVPYTVAIHTLHVSQSNFFFNLFHVCFLHLYDFETLKKRTLSSQLERNPDVLNAIGEGSQV